MAASVRELLEESVQATSRGDEIEIARLYHPNAALQMPGADPIVGRDAIAEHFRSVLTGKPEDMTHEVTEEHIHRITPDLAIVDTVGTSRSGDRSEVEGFTMIAVRDDEGEWLWAGMRGTLVRS